MVYMALLILHRVSVVSCIVWVFDDPAVPVGLQLLLSEWLMLCWCRLPSRDDMSSGFKQVFVRGTILWRDLLHAVCGCSSQVKSAPLDTYTHHPQTDVSTNLSVSTVLMQVRLRRQNCGIMSKYWTMCCFFDIHAQKLLLLLALKQIQLNFFNLEHSAELVMFSYEEVNYIGSY